MRYGERDCRGNQMRPARSRCTTSIQHIHTTERCRCGACRAALDVLTRQTIIEELGTLNTQTADSCLTESRENRFFWVAECFLPYFRIRPMFCSSAGLVSRPIWPYKSSGRRRSESGGRLDGPIDSAECRTCRGNSRSFGFAQVAGPRTQLHRPLFQAVGLAAVPCTSAYKTRAPTQSTALLLSYRRRVTCKRCHLDRHVRK